MSPTSHFFFVGKQKNSADIKSVRKCGEEIRLALLSVPPEKNPGLFSDSQTVVSNKFISHARSIYRICRMRCRICRICCMRKMQYRICRIDILSNAFSCDPFYPTEEGGGASSPEQ